MGEWKTEINEYLEKAKKTAHYPKLSDVLDNYKVRKQLGQGVKEFDWIYPFIGLVGELGEMANILKKVMRDDLFTIRNEIREKLDDENGDIFWYLVVLIHELGLDPKQVLEHNIEKLKKRYDIGD